RRGDHRADFEVDEVVPLRDPLIEERPVVGRHHLVAAAQAGLDPAVDIAEAGGCQTTALAETAVDGRRIARLEVLDHHVQRLRHAPSYPGTGNVADLLKEK